MRPTGLRAVVVLAATSLVVTVLTSSTASAVPAPSADAGGRTASPSARATSTSRSPTSRDDLEGTSADLVAAAVALKRSQARLVDGARRARLGRRPPLAAAEEAGRRARLRARLRARGGGQGRQGARRPGAGRGADPGPLGRLAREAYSGLRADRACRSRCRPTARTSSPSGWLSPVRRCAAQNERGRPARRRPAETAGAGRPSSTALRARIAELKRAVRGRRAARRRPQAQAAAAEAAADPPRRRADRPRSASSRPSSRRRRRRLDAAQAEQAQLEGILKDRAEKAARRAWPGGARSAQPASSGSSSGGQHRRATRRSAAPAAAAGSCRTRPTRPSPPASGCATTRSCTTGGCTPAPTSASPAARRSTRPPPTARSSARRLGRRVRQPDRRRPRLRRAASTSPRVNHLSPDLVHSGLGVARAAHRLLRDDRPVHRLPPALRGLVNGARVNPMRWL